MGQTRSMVVVPSPDPEKDRALLQEILPFSRQTSSDEDDAIILLWQEECLVVVPSTVASKVSWVLINSNNWDQVLKAGQNYLPTRTHVLSELSTKQGLRLILPSGSSLVVVTSDSVASDKDRKILVKYLLGSGQMNGVHDSVVQKIKLPIRTMESSGSLVSDVSLDDSRSSISPRKNKGLTMDAPNFPSLSVKLMQQQGTWDTNFALNTREAYPFETDLFKGRILMLVRPPNLEDDPYWSDRIFRHKKRRVLFNIQGKFKRPLKGPLYVGGEITSPMNLSLFTRGVLGMLIKLMETGFSDLRYSFGDEKKNLCPRIAVPAFSGMERLVVTPPDQTPPPISGDPFEESKEDRTKRLRSKEWEWNSTDTYSFTFFSMYLSLATWKLVNLPVSTDINLRRLWNDGDLRLVMYEKVGAGKEHPPSSISYALNMNLRYLGDRRVSEEESSEPEDFEDIALDSDRGQNGYKTPTDESESGVWAFRRSESANFPAIMEGDTSSDEEDFFDAKSDVVEPTISQEFSSTPSEVVELLASIDKVVPAWFQIASGKGHYVRAFAFNRENSTVFVSASDAEDFLDSFSNSRRIKDQVDEHFSPRLSSHERSRRRMGVFLKENGENALNMLLKKSSWSFDGFLRRNPLNISRGSDGTLKQGFAARALSDRHWEEEYLVLSSGGYLTCYHPEKRKIRLRVQISNILKVSALPSRLAPAIHTYSFLCIETLGRCIYFMMPSKEARDEWTKTFWDLQKNLAADERSVDSEVSRRILNIDQPSDEFLHKSSIWNYKNRRILNCGEYRLKCTSELENPLDMVTEALRLSVEANRDESGERRHLFFRCAGALKRAMVQTLSEKSRLAFFLNLYHLMVMHAFLVLGPPGSGLKWISFFNNLAYEVGDDIFSISELEHCIIRAQMTHPSQLISRFVIPKSHYRMALEKGDFRINFALNPGSVSSPSSALVYSPDKIDEQLDQAAKLYIEKASVTVKGSNDVIVNLPRICQWFQDDFGSQEELLSKIVPFMKTTDSLSIDQAKSAGQNISIRFDDFSFKCRQLSLK